MENTTVPQEWKREQLNKYIIEHSEKTTSNNQYPVLTSSRRGLFLQADYYNKAIASEDNTGYNVVPYGFFTFRHMSDDEIFRFNINTIVPKGIVSTLYPVFTTKNIDDRYLLELLNNGNEFSRFVRTQKQGGSRTYIYFSKLQKLKVTIPPLSEQNAIAEILITQDTLISTAQRLLAAKKQQKRWLMQNLLTGKVRLPGFNGKWENVKLNSFITESKLRNRNNQFGKSDVLSVSGESGVVNQIEHMGRSYAGVSVTEYHVVETGDVVYTKSPLKNAPYGIIKTNFGEVGIVSTLYAVYKCKNSITAHYLNHYFSRDDNLNRYLCKIVRKGAKNDMKVNNEAVLTGRILIPTIAEQTAITERLTTADREIELITRDLEQQMLVKKYLMQQLLTGKIRVKGATNDD